MESHRDSAADLERNAAAPDVKNVRMIRETAEDFLRRFAGAPPSLVVLDPPRRGAGPRVLEPLVALRPSRLAYVSCDPATLARDLAYLIERGYELSSLDLVELFPQTFHIENRCQAGAEGLVGDESSHAVGCGGLCRWHPAEEVSISQFAGYAGPGGPGTVARGGPHTTGEAVAGPGGFRWPGS